MSHVIVVSCCHIYRVAYSLLQSLFQMVMENIENTPVKDKKKKKKEKEKDLGEMQVKLLLQ